MSDGFISICLSEIHHSAVVRIDRSYNNGSCSVSVSSSLHLVFNLSSIPTAESVTAAELRFVHRPMPTNATAALQLSVWRVRHHQSASHVVDEDVEENYNDQLLDVVTLKSSRLCRDDVTGCSLSFDVTPAISLQRQSDSDDDSCRQLRLRVRLRTVSTTTTTSGGVKLQLVEAPTLIVYTHDGLQTTTPTHSATTGSVRDRCNKLFLKKTFSTLTTFYILNVFIILLTIFI